MVSRQETARPLLTAGEVMQLPHDDELVLVSGCPPIRAKKIRYYQDKDLSRRVLPPPALAPAKTAAPSSPIAPAPWNSTVAANLSVPSDPANGGPRREPELPEHEDIAPEKPNRQEEFLFEDEREDDGPPAAFQKQVRNAVRQTPLDPSDDLGM
jgi:type IV secretion system protein VirD4